MYVNGSHLIHSLSSSLYINIAVFFKIQITQKNVSWSHYANLLTSKV